jgi:hypothetical protein
VINYLLIVTTAVSFNVGQTKYTVNTHNLTSREKCSNMQKEISSALAKAYNHNRENYMVICVHNEKEKS